MKKVNGFVRLDEIWWHGDRPCLIFVPMVYLEKGGLKLKELIWIEYILPPADVCLVEFNELEIGNGENERIIYGPGGDDKA